jgi:hypothetical protein
MMNQTYLWAGVILVVVLILAAVNRGQLPAYRKKKILTGNEAEFYFRLCRALPDHLIFPQVAMSALIEPKTANQKKRKHAFYRISQKVVDYAVFKHDLTLVAIVELDDKTHSASKDKIRDAYLSSAGIKTIRFQSKHKPSSNQIMDSFLNLSIERK